MKTSTSKWLIFFLCICVSVFGQSKLLTVAEVLSKTEAALKNNKYITFNTKYTMYSDYTSNKIYEQYSGVFLKKETASYVKIKNTEFIAFDNYGLKINNDEKALQIRKDAGAVFEESPLSVTSFLKVFENKTMKTDNEYYICELKPGKISQVMLSKVVIYVRKSDFSITKQLLYYVEKMESKDKNGKKIFTVPRLEITFSTRVKDIKKDDLLLNKDTYFTINKNDITVSKRFAGYKIFKA